MIDLYILEGRTPKRVDDWTRWSRWMRKADRYVRRTVIGPLTVSTEFLGLDHNWFGGVPLLFQTRVFGMEEDSYQTRCSTWDEAERAHAEARDFARGLVADAEHALAGFWSTLGR
jgi:hypothetical protein